MTRADPPRALLLALIALAFGLRLSVILAVQQGPVFDELMHLGIGRVFGPGLPAFEHVRDYPSGSGPFFYLVLGNLEALCRYDLTALRLAMFALALVNLLLFWRIVARMPVTSPAPAVALLATTPYFVALAGLVMTEHLALLLGLASLLFYLRSEDGAPSGRAGPRIPDTTLCIVFATLAAYTRSYFVFLPASFALTTAMRGPARWPRALALLLPLLAFLPLVLLWHGLAPPQDQENYHPGFNVRNLSSVLVWTGLFTLPWFPRRIRPWHVIGLLAIPVVLASPIPGEGILQATFQKLPRLPVMGIAAALGAVGLVFLARTVVLTFADARLRVAAVATLVFCLGLSVSGPTIFERYMLPGYPMMLLCCQPWSSPGLALGWAALFQWPVSIAYMVHKVLRAG